MQSFSERTLVRSRNLKFSLAGRSLCRRTRRPRQLKAQREGRSSERRFLTGAHKRQITTADSQQPNGVLSFSQPFAAFFCSSQSVRPLIELLGVSLARLHIAGRPASILPPPRPVYSNSKTEHLVVLKQEKVRERERELRWHA